MNLHDLLARRLRYNRSMADKESPYLLIVEDVPTVREMLEITLRFNGYAVDSAANGEEALAKIAERMPDLLITDLLMPKLDGFMLAQRLRRDPKTRLLPIIFISATYITPEDKEFALSLGAVRFLEKPIDTEEFLLTIAEVLQEKAAAQSQPLDDETFYRGYLERLENKLRYKINQITRLERLIPTLPESQRPSFTKMLASAKRERQVVQEELEAVKRLLQNPPTEE